MQHSPAFSILLPGALALGLGAAAAPAAADFWPSIARWTPAVLVPVSDPNFADGCPIETPDGLSLVFASARSGRGNNDVWVADRTAIGAPWQAPRKLEFPRSATLSDDGKRLFFGRSGDIYMSERR